MDKSGSDTNHSTHSARAQGGIRSAREALEPADGPPPPKRSRQARNFFVVVFHSIITVMVIGAFVASAAVYFGKLMVEEEGPLETTRTVVVREGSSVARIAAQLEAAGVIDSELAFRIAARAYGVSSEMKPGEYAFNPHVSMYDVMQTIRQGKGVIHKVTFPEGWTTHQIFERLAQNDILVGDLPEEMPAEGSLMPDTYPFQRGTTREEIIERMQRAHDRFVSRVWDNRIEGLPISTPEELVTLASIVERETGRADERPRVASVFINRLNRGMRLQSDPTIIYGIFGGQGLPEGRPIYQSDIDRPTPYNTYTIDGLPPGPIANPGRASLEAVANPSRTEDLYFVADGTGGHAFAKTLDEHNENVRRWRAIEARLREEREEAEAAAAAAGTASEAVEASDAAEEQADEPAQSEAQ